MAGAIVLPLQELIASLDKNCFPRFLQVYSGVYFQGSLYDISGYEVSFSTGDLIKVIGTELLSICCKDLSTNETFELPITHTGLFKIVPEEKPYSSIEEMVALRPVMIDSSFPFTFTSCGKMALENVTVPAGTVLTVLSMEQQEGEKDKLRCKVHGQNEASAEIFIPLSVHGEFVECESEECFTLQEIVSLPSLLSRRFFFINKKSDHPLVLTPVYRVNAIMNLRKNILKFPSSLEVDVVDVTEDCKDVIFERPLSLTEVLSIPKEYFPVVVNILEQPDSFSLLKCNWMPQLTQCQRLVFHKAGNTSMVALSSMKNQKTQKYFLVSDIYGGRFRRQPRAFSSVYELYVASLQAPGLRVSVTRNSEVEGEGLPLLRVGEQLEVVCCQKMNLPHLYNTRKPESVDALLCQYLPEQGCLDDDNEDEECLEDGKQEVILPLYMQNHFVEVLTENRKYSLKDLGKRFSLPLDIKMVSRDAKLQNDPLVGLPYLQIESVLIEPTILASFPQSPEYCFEIPAQWISMDVSFTTEPLPRHHNQQPMCHVESVTEVTNTLFYEFCKRDTPDAPPPPPPPRPPKSYGESSTQKWDRSCGYQAQKITPTESLANLTLNVKRRPQAMLPLAPPVMPRKQFGLEMTICKTQGNTYIKKREIKKNALLQVPEDAGDSNHDYETVEEQNRFYF